mgnify:CR=1 FL=1
MVRKKILILGATGMLGHVVYRYFSKIENYQLFNTVYRTKLTEDSLICDVRKDEDLKAVFEKVEPDIIINCVGALIKESKEDPTNTIYLNALFPNKLKDLCDKFEARLIQVSTDCVFSGQEGNYSEDDFRNADDVYGRSKALGEISDKPHCTLRTSIVGPELKENGTGLYHWFMSQDSQVKGFTNALWSGVTTLELSKAIDKAIQNELSGLFHVTNGYPISKYELLKLFNKLRKDKISIIPDGQHKINKTLNKSKKFDFEVADYDQMIQEMNAYNLELH